jgi:ferritin
MRRSAKTLSQSLFLLSHSLKHKPTRPFSKVPACPIYKTQERSAFEQNALLRYKHSTPFERLPMLTSKKVINAINEQIGYEFSASMQYYAIAAHFAAEALPQLSQHFFQQAEEEKGHALRFIKYVVDAGGRVVIPAIDAPKSNFKTPKDAVKLSLDQEVHVTQQINGLVGLARSENDYITINFLQWFLTEQLEEVSSMDNLLKIVQRAGDDLLQADEYLARVGVRAMPEPAKE